MNKCELFPGWELSKDTRDYGFAKGWGIKETSPTGRCHAVLLGAPNGFTPSEAFKLLRRWARARKPI